MRPPSSAIEHLSNVDPIMRKLILEVGPCTLRPRVRRSPFESLVRAIAYQQLHEKAAESILKRLIAQFPGQRFPRPDQLLALQTRAIRRAGFHEQKSPRSAIWRPKSSMEPYRRAGWSERSTTKRLSNG